MSGYNIFDEAIPKEHKGRYQQDLAQAKGVIDVANLISEALLESKMSQVEFAKKASLSEGYISRVLGGHENITVKNAAKLLHILGKRYIQTSEEISKNNITDMYTYSQNKMKMKLEYDKKSSEKVNYG